MGRLRVLGEMASTVSTALKGRSDGHRTELCSQIFERVDLFGAIWKLYGQIVLLRLEFGDTRDPEMVANIEFLIRSYEGVQCTGWCFRVARFGGVDNELRTSLWISDEWIIDAFAWKLAIHKISRIDFADIILVEHCVDVVSFMDREDIPVAVN